MRGVRAALRWLLLAASLTVSVWAVVRLFAGGAPVPVVAWIGGALVGHDVLLVPLCGALALLLGSGRRRGLAWLRWPAALSLVLLLAWFPLVMRLDPGPYEAGSGLSAAVFLPHWLAVSLALFLVAGAAVAARTAFRAARAREDPPDEGQGRSRQV